MPMLADDAAWHALPAETGTRIVVSRSPLAADREVLRGSVSEYAAGRAAILLDVSRLSPDSATERTLQKVATCLAEDVPVTAGLVAVVGTVREMDMVRSLESQAQRAGVFARSFEDDAMACAWLRTVGAALDTHPANSKEILI